MKLRGRLAWIVLATTAPLVAVAAWSMNEVWDRMAVHTLRESVLYRMENGGREQCERSPGTFVLPPPIAEEAAAPIPPPGLGHLAPRMLLPAAQLATLHAYSSALVSANPDAPAFPAELREELESGAEVAAEFLEDGRRRELQLALRMPWRDGPCAVMLARQEIRPNPRATHDLFVGSAIVGLGLVIAVLLAAGPAVARIRALAAGVRRSSSDHWKTPVEERGTDEIADLARAFNGAAAEVRTHVQTLERREQTLRAFVANTDHDLTIPLTVLLGQLTEMRRRVESGAPVDAAQLRAAAREADYMASLVRNLGVAARLEAGEPEAVRSVVDLNALVERVVARHRPIASTAGVTLEFAVPEQVVQVHGDETLLEQAASNLVHNAVRHNRAGGHVAVTLEGPKAAKSTKETRDSSGETFVLSVRDDGPGIPDAELARLTAPDADAIAARPRAPGRGGLGLRIVRKVAQQHGLQFRLRAREGGGLVAELEGPCGSSRS